MNGILEMLFILKRDYKVIEGAKVQKRPATKVVGKCPCCGSEVAEKMKGYFCSDKDCHFVLWKNQAFFASLGKKITPSVAETLLKEGKVFLTGCRSAKTGNSYDATVLMRVDERKRPQFSLSFEKGEKVMHGE